MPDSVPEADPAELRALTAEEPPAQDCFSQVPAAWVVSARPQQPAPTYLRPCSGPQEAKTPQRPVRRPGLEWESLAERPLSRGLDPAISQRPQLRFVPALVAPARLAQASIARVD